jgi:hypothetical protein
MPHKSAFLSVVVLLILPVFARAQYDDEPASRVARISYTRGAVSFEPAGTQEWVDAFINRPMTTGDALWSDRGSRVALNMGSASVHLSEYTSCSFLNLTDRSVQIQLSTGTLRIRVKRLGDDENFEVDTPSLAFSVLRPGIYKISVNSNGDTTVIEDRRGEGEVTGEGLVYDIRPGETGSFSGTNQLAAIVQPMGYDEDDFERWSEDRDHHEDISISARYMSDDAIGYDDLDDNGGWRPVPQYGMIWFPHVEHGWAPYHYGHWAYIAPWGYTWVDDAAWGFAPFHYGRWVWVGNSWGWVPCPPRPPAYTPAYIQPVYAPALVAWVGGMSFGVGVGWFPLGPREVYVPSYPVSRSYFNNVNASNITVNKTVINNYYTNVVVNKNVNVTNVTYVNQRVNGAVAATSVQAFASGRSVSANVVHVDARQINAAPVSVMTPRTVPQRESMFGGRAPVSARPSAAIQARTVVVKTAPPPPAPSFERRQAAIQSNGGRPLSMAETRRIAPAPAQPREKLAPPAKPAVPAIAPVREAVQGRPAAKPPTAYPVPKQMEERHEEQNVDLHKAQDQQYQKLKEEQQKQSQLLQEQKGNEAKQQQVEQQHQQQMEQLERQHQQQQRELQQRQEAEHERLEKQHPKPKPQEKPTEEKPQEEKPQK